MKILCIFTDAGPYYVRSGWGRVFNYLGHEFHFWDQSKIPALDIFNIVNPDIFLGTTYDLDSGTIKAIAKRPNLKVALFCSAWGPFFGIRYKDIKDDYPIDWVKDEEIENVSKLKNLTGKPDFVFLHCTPSSKDEVIGSWKNQLRIETASIMNAADLFVYGLGKEKEELKCDIGFIGGYWPYKAKNINKFLLPLCYEDKYNIKIFSRSNWPVYQNLGYIEDSEAKNLFASSKICINISEPHSTEWGYDIVERVFKTISAGGYCISDYVKGIEEVLPANTVPMFKDYDELQNLITKRLSTDEDELKESMKFLRDYVVDAHSYFNRVEQMFDLFEMFNESVDCMVKGQEFINENFNNN